MRGDSAQGQSGSSGQGGGDTGGGGHYCGVVGGSAAGGTHNSTDKLGRGLGDGHSTMHGE